MSRGKILRDTSAGSGIVFVDGQQKTFTLEQHWRSGVPPATGATVEVELSPQGEVVSVTHVDEATIAKEQAAKALGAASVQGKAALAGVVGTVGIAGLICLAALIVSWTLLNMLSVNIYGNNSQGFSFYNIMALVNQGGNGLQSMFSNSGGAGFYGFLMWVVMLCPVLAHVLPRNKWAQLSYAVPLAFFLIFWLVFYFKVNAAANQAVDMGSGFAGEAYRQMMEESLKQAKSMAWKAIHLGLGFYVSLFLLPFMAWKGIKGFLTAK